MKEKQEDNIALGEMMNERKKDNQIMNKERHLT
jgi:hypothetical protein